MGGNLKEKHNLMLKIEKYERALIELTSWNPEVELSASTKEMTGKILNESIRDEWVQVFRNILSVSEAEKSNTNGKLYLSEIVEIEKPKFSDNNLILAPTGSGKTQFLKSLISNDEVLLLVSTTSLKDKFVPESLSRKEELASRMFSTKRKEVYGKESYKILVMTYAEFGNKIEYTNNFADQYKQIFCDEIHSLLHYRSINKSDTLLGAIKYLFSKKSGQEKYYFTATDEYLEKLKSNSRELFDNIKVFNYLEHPNIVRHIALSSYRINGLEQVRPHLKARLSRFKYFNHKAFAFCKTIDSQLYLKKIMEEEGFTPLVLWSINNESRVMDEEQLLQREYLLRTGLIPDGYNSLIINSAMQEGWDLIDPSVKLVIMNTINETELVQAIGRVRQDLDVLVYRVSTGEADYYLDFPQDLIGVPLTSEMKDNLCNVFNIRNQNGRPLKWTSIKSVIEGQGLLVEDKVIKVDKKAARVSIVSYQ